MRSRILAKMEDRCQGIVKDRPYCVGVDILVIFFNSMLVIYGAFWYLSRIFHSLF